MSSWEDGDDSEELRFEGRDYDSLEEDDFFDGVNLQDGAAFAEARVHPMLAMQGPRGAEFLYDSGYEGKKMSVGDRFGWLIGSAYLIGGGGGVAIGALRGWAGRAGYPLKLRLNGALNAAGRSGGAASRAASMALFMYASIDWASSFLRGRQDNWNSLAAWTVTPMILASSRGTGAGVLAASGGLAAGSGFVFLRNRDVFGLKRIFPVDNETL